MSKPRKKFQLVATTFDRKGRPIATAQNDYRRSHPLAKYFALQAGESEHKDKIHAELNSVLSSGKNEVHSIFVQRFNKDGSMANAKPCTACQLMLKSFGVKLVRYTDNDGIKEYVNE